ncbi:MAG TPA: hypothetical protein VFR72_08660, partial [Gemmatimonadales bacterium]|nr:hypothetical protein [Gemmatimonadales bacterium]
MKLGPRALLAVLGLLVGALAPAGVAVAQDTTNTVRDTTAAATDTAAVVNDTTAGTPDSSAVTDTTGGTPLVPDASEAAAVPWDDSVIVVDRVVAVVGNRPVLASQVDEELFSR